MSERIKPLGNRILVKRLQVKTSKGGILLPDSAQEKPKEGEVLAVGPGKCNEDGILQAMSVQCGRHFSASRVGGGSRKTSG